MKHVYPTNEIAHLWAHKTQTSARNGQGNFYFDGDTIYSYGSHFPIARHVAAAAGNAVLFTTRTRSVTTSRHVSDVRRAIPDAVPVFECHNVSDQPRTISEAKGKAVTELTGQLEKVAAPKRTYPALQKIEQALVNPDGGLSEPVAAFAGKRLSMHKSPGRNDWSITHRATGYQIESVMEREQARAILASIDKMKAWDKITADGKMAPELKETLWSAISKARRQSDSVAGVNRNPATVAKLWTSLESAVQTANEFNEFFGFKTQYTIPATIEPLRTIVESYRAGQAERRRVRDAARMAKYSAQRIAREKQELEWAEKQPELIAAWRNGSNPEALRGHLSSLPCMLRVSAAGDEIETSLGARFPVSHAHKVLPIVQALWAEGREYQRNGHTIHLGHYELDKVTATTVEAGCHIVPRAEVERIAAELAERVEVSA